MSKGLFSGMWRYRGAPNAEHPASVPGAMFSPNSPVASQDQDRQDETVYPCPSCDRKFRWKGSLKTHLRLECGKEPSFFCPFCPHRTKLKGNLRKHVFNKHHERMASMGDF